MLEVHNQRPFQGKDYSRRQRFEDLESGELATLPATRYLMQSYRMAKVQTNCHVLLLADKHYYSVPHRLVGQRLKLIYSQQTVEIYHQHERIATHTRSTRLYGYTTRPKHLPAGQQWVAQWSPTFFREQAQSLGASVQQAIEALLAPLSQVPARYPLVVYRSCAGLLSLHRLVGTQRLNNACERALQYGSVSYKLVRRILDADLDRAPLVPPVESPPLPAHGNIRGASAYQ